MAVKNVALILVLILMATATAGASRSNNELKKMNKPGYNLQARLQACGYGGSARKCLKAMEALESCGNAIGEFFLLGDIDITHCCTAIGNVTDQCSILPFPNMHLLPSFGFTYLESDLLNSYCGAASSSPPVITPPFHA